MTEIQIITEPAQIQMDLVFIHGLSGDATDTWTVKTTDVDEESFWPLWLVDEFQTIGVYSFGYPASLFEKWAKKEMNLHERAENFLEQMVSVGLGKRPIAFITHSLGGIMAKEILRASQDSLDTEWNSIAKSTSMVAFLATPHTGASLATVLNAVLPRSSSRHIKTLANNDGYLTSLNKSFRDIATKNSIYTVSYFENFKAKNFAVVVGVQSADPGVGNIHPVGIDADHMSICKPPHKSAIIYRSLCRHIRNQLKGLPIFEIDGIQGSNGGLFNPFDYTEISESDRRDLLQKLIDAGREQDYKTANELQNRFAQSYHKLGLHTEAKKFSDLLLSEVEQRFITHIYHGPICSGGSDDEIAHLLQREVIDAVCDRHSGADNISPTAVLQALYFLTAKCHISWNEA